MNSDEKILQALKALQDDMTAVKSETVKIQGIGERQERNDKLLTGLSASMATVLEEQHAQRSDIRSLLTDLGTLHEEFQTAHEEVTGEIRAARAEAKMDNIDLKATVAKKIQSHERRITNIEEREGIENPEKH